MDCHNEGRVDTWTIGNYETVVSYSSIIKEVIRTKRMPPPKGSKYLSPQDIRTLILWITQGAVRGEGPDPLK